MTERAFDEAIRALNHMRDDRDDWRFVARLMTVAFAVVLGVAIALLVSGCTVNPDTLQECGDHCRVFPSDLVAEDVRPHLRVTSAGFLCVPDRNVADGMYRPLKCESLLNTEGRCLATCIPAVEKFAPLLPEGAPCAPGEVCAPCANPFTGEPTGACLIGNDAPEGQ